MFEKLDLKPHIRAAVGGVGETAFLASLPEHVVAVTRGRVPQGVEVVFFGAEARTALDKAPMLRARISDTGAFWVIGPKKSKAVTEHDVLTSLRGAGFVDTKVVAFSRTHTIHKFVVPLETRVRGHVPGARRPSRPTLKAKGAAGGEPKPRKSARNRAALPECQ